MVLTCLFATASKILTSRDYNRLVSKSERLGLVSAGEANVSVSAGEGLGLVSGFNVSCPSLRNTMQHNSTTQTAVVQQLNLLSHNSHKSIHLPFNSCWSNAKSDLHEVFKRCRWIQVIKNVPLFIQLRTSHNTQCSQHFFGHLSYATDLSHFTAKNSSVIQWYHSHTCFIHWPFLLKLLHVRLSDPLEKLWYYHSRFLQGKSAVLKHRRQPKTNAILACNHIARQNRMCDMACRATF